MPPNHARHPRADRRRRMWWVAAVILAGSMAGSAALGVATSAWSHDGTTAPTSPRGPEGIPLQAGALLAPESTAETGRTVDGIQCDASEHVAYHIHTHLAVYVDGALRPIPSGIIHVESPTARTYTLGQFFAIWRQPLSAHRVGPARGPVTVFVDGSRYSGNPADTTLGAREDIQIDVGRPVVAPARVDWHKSQL